MSKRGGGLDLVTIFNGLPDDDTDLDGSTSRFVANSIPNTQHRVARDADGNACILLAVGETKGAGAAPIQLENLLVQHSVECRVSHPRGKVEERRFTVIRYTGGERDLRTQFLRTVGSLIAALGAQSSAAEVTSLVRSLVELFRALEGPATGTVQGLWAELLILSRATNVARLAEAWHALPTDRYDFNAGPNRLEVKSALGRLRSHRFSLEQITPPAGSTVLIASLLFERAGGGLSLRELLDDVRQKLGVRPDLLMRVDSVVLTTLGKDLASSLDERFDRQLAESSIRYFETSSIPSVSRDLPPEVSDVHFTSALNDVPSLSLSQVVASGSLFSLLR